MAQVAPVLVCFALEDEAVPFRRQVISQAHIRILITGVGQENAAHSIQAALPKEDFRLVLSCGYAGGLNPELTFGQVVFDADQDARLQQALAAAGGRAARFFCSKRVLTSKVEKAAARQQTGADAVELESEAIRSACRARGVTTANVRVILDTAAEDLPLDFNSLFKPDAGLQMQQLLCALLRKPQLLPSLLRLRRRSRTAAAILSTYLARVVGG